MVGWKLPEIVVIETQFDFQTRFSLTWGLFQGLNLTFSVFGGPFHRKFLLFINSVDC